MGPIDFSGLLWFGLLVGVAVTLLGVFAVWPIFRLFVLWLAGVIA